jgi:hypothetical protein
VDGATAPAAAWDDPLMHERFVKEALAALLRQYPFALGDGS